MLTPEVPEIPISVDGEFTGPIPGPFSMISFGAVAFEPGGKELSSFKINIKELEGSGRHPVTMAWWAEHYRAWEAATEDPHEPVEAMSQFARWLGTLPGRPKLIGWPLPVDFMFIYWYFVRFLQIEPPFSYDGIDIKTYAMCQLKRDTLSGETSGTSRKFVREVLKISDTEFSHDPLDDAREQAKLYFGLRRLSNS